MGKNKKRMMLKTVLDIIILMLTINNNREWVGVLQSDTVMLRYNSMYTRT